MTVGWGIAGCGWVARDHALPALLTVDGALPTEAVESLVRVAEDIAACIAWMASRPAHVNIDRMTVRPRAQAAQHKVHRVSDRD